MKNKNRDTILTVVIPCYNEEGAIEIFISELLSFCVEKPYKILVINDGSKDKTNFLLKEYENNKQIKIISHKVNKGYGAAVKTGIKNCDTEYCITLDSDGQHSVADIDRLLNSIISKDADMIIGSRKGEISNSRFRDFGKWIIRNFAKIFMKLNIYDINSGMRIFRRDVILNYLHLLPDSFPFCDISSLIFIYNKHLIYEEPIEVKKRLAGESVINIYTAFDTFMQILNISVLFNPMKLFLPVSVLLILFGVVWGSYYISLHRGLSVGASLFVITGVLTFFIGLLAEQLSAIRRHMKN